MGQLGTMPAVDLPDSHNAGDFGAFLLGAPHRHAVTAEQLADRTDGHLDIDAVRAGAILVCPVKIPGGGVYLGDMHAMQGDGEIAGHTADVAGTVTLQVSVVKDLDLDGPILFPVAEDLPFLARPLTARERTAAEALAARHGADRRGRAAGVVRRHRARPQQRRRERPRPRGAILGMEVPEVMNRATISGAIEIGAPRRDPGHVPGAGRGPRRARARGLRARAVRRPGLRVSAAGDGEHDDEPLPVAQRPVAADDLALHGDGDSVQELGREAEVGGQRRDEVGDPRPRSRVKARRPRPGSPRAGPGRSPQRRTRTRA